MLRPDDDDGFRIGVGDVARSLATGSFMADLQASPHAPATDAGPDETTVLPAPIVPEVLLRPPPSAIVVPGSSEISTHPGLDRPYFTRVARIGRQVAEALEYANRQGVLHRDIKPSNLLLDTAGNVWVADFGLAKTADADDLTVTGDLVGTLRYMAPERFQGQCDARSDVYSLGLSLYELVALHPAFMETDRYKLIERIRREQPAPLKKLAPRVPRDLETIIHKAIQIEPPRRYATAAALADDLRRFLEDQPIQARRASRAERVARWCRQNPWVAVSFVILCLGTAISVWQAIRARTAEATARTERTRAESEAETAKAVNEFLNKDLLAQASAHNQAVPNAKPDPDLKVRTALDCAAATIGERFAGRPVLEASIRQTIGETYQELGLYPNAKIHLECALELRRRELGPNHPDTFIAMESLSKLHLADDRLAEAEPLLRQRWKDYAACGVTTTPTRSTR